MMTEEWRLKTEGIKLRKEGKREHLKDHCMKTSQMKKQEEDWGQRKKSDYLREKTEDRRKIAMKP